MIKNSELFWKAKKAEFIFSLEELKKLRRKYSGLRHLELALFFKKRAKGDEKSEIR